MLILLFAAFSESYMTPLWLFFHTRINSWFLLFAWALSWGCAWSCSLFVLCWIHVNSSKRSGVCQLCFSWAVALEEQQSAARAQLSQILEGRGWGEALQRTVRPQLFWKEGSISRRHMGSQSILLSFPAFRLLTVVGKHRGESSSPGPKAASAPGITPLTPRCLK